MKTAQYIFSDSDENVLKNLKTNYGQNPKNFEIDETLEQKKLPNFSGLQENLTF